MEFVNKYLNNDLKYEVLSEVASKGEHELEVINTKRHEVSGNVEMEKLKKLEKNLDYYKDRDGYFTDYGIGVSEDVIEDAEDILEFKLPKSYKWFLKKYGTGAILGEQILGVREEGYKDLGKDGYIEKTGDIVENHLQNKGGKVFKDNEIEVYIGDEDSYYFDLNEDKEDLSVYSKFGGEKYADDFIDFIDKRLSEEYN